MCGRFRLKRFELNEAAAMGVLSKFDEFSEIKIVSRFDHYIPSNNVPIVRLDADRRVLDSAAWGFVPNWARGDKKLPRPINAKAETIATSGMFKDAFRRTRCLLPVDGFFEPKGPKGMKKRQQYYFRRPDGATFALAGIFSATAEGLTCAVTTTAPNSVVGQIHNRMPLILKTCDYGKWLDPMTPIADVHAMMTPCSSDDLIVEPPAEDEVPGLFG